MARILVQWDMGWPFSLPRSLSRILFRRPARLDMSAFAPVPSGAYLVGGAVRDTLLGVEPADLDWLVSDPETACREISEATGGRPFALDHERGHWRLIVPPPDGRTLDFIPLRGPLEEDLLARDFTVNALAADSSGRVTDVQGGLRDLRSRVLRMTSEQALRDDPLRLLRAPRLSVRFGFALDSGTRAAIVRGSADIDSGLLPLPAWERIHEELDALVLGPSPGSAMAQLEGLGLLAILLPELAGARGVEQGGLHHLDVLDHSLEALQRLATIFPDADVALRWATLLHDVGKPRTRERGEDGRTRFYGHDRHGAELARSAMRRLRRSIRELDRIAALVRYHMLPLPRGDRQARRFAHRRRELLPDLLKLMIADREAARGPLSSEATRRAYRTSLSRIVAILEEPPPLAPLLDGREVMEILGLPEGPQVGEALRFLGEARAVGDVTDREQARAALEGLARARGWLS
ncbi:MAG: HD domain-containing protein [Trueperaceae bacterium]